MTEIEIELKVGAFVQILGRGGVWKIDRFVARCVVLVPVSQPSVEAFRESTDWRE